MRCGNIKRKNVIKKIIETLQVRNYESLNWGNGNVLGKEEINI